MLDTNDLRLICVVREDLRNSKGQKIHKGKYVAQAGHAFVACALNYPDKDKEGIIHKQWLKESYKKICLKVDSLDELLSIYEQAKINGLNVHLITDNGHTEFDEPTITCIGIGPDYKDELDKVTGQLSLF